MKDVVCCPSYKNIPLKYGQLSKWVESWVSVVSTREVPLYDLMCNCCYHMLLVHHSKDSHLKFII